MHMLEFIVQVKLLIQIEDFGKDYSRVYPFYRIFSHSFSLSFLFSSHLRIGVAMWHGLCNIVLAV